MFLFILESIGTSELVLIGIVALMFLGPRRMPEMARKVAKFMAQFRGTANEFKDTWRRELDFESAAKEFDLNNLEAEVATTKPAVAVPVASEIKPVDPARAAELKATAARATEAKAAATAAANDKKNWL